MGTLAVFADALHPFTHVGVRTITDSPHFFAADSRSWFCLSLAISANDTDNFVIAWKPGAEAFVQSVFG